nr:hypothetical protein HK105_005460 [Polyrhizophydium stewartii]
MGDLFLPVFLVSSLAFASLMLALALWLRPRVRAWMVPAECDERAWITDTEAALRPQTMVVVRAPVAGADAVLAADPPPPYIPAYSRHGAKLAAHRYTSVYPCASKLLAKKWDDAARKRHLEKLKTMRARIDNVQPRKLNHLAIPSKKLLNKQETCKRIEYENQLLLERMRRLFSAPSSYSCVSTLNARTMANRLNKSKMSKRKRGEMLAQIHKENLALMHRVENKQGHYQVKDCDRDREQHLRYLLNMTRFPEAYSEAISKDASSGLQQSAFSRILEHDEGLEGNISVEQASASALGKHQGVPQLVFSEQDESNSSEAQMQAAERSQNGDHGDHNDSFFFDDQDPPKNAGRDGDHHSPRTTQGQFDYTGSAIADTPNASYAPSTHSIPTDSRAYASDLDAGVSDIAPGDGQSMHGGFQATRSTAEFEDKPTPPRQPPEPQPQATLVTGNVLLTHASAFEYDLDDFDDEDISALANVPVVDVAVSFTSAVPAVSSSPTPPVPPSEVSEAVVSSHASELPAKPVDEPAHTVSSDTAALIAAASLDFFD